MASAAEIAYWVVCYTIMSMAWIVSLGRVLVRRNVREISHFLVVSSLFVLMIGATPVRVMPSLPDEAKEAFGLAGAFAVCLLLYAIPVFVVGTSSSIPRANRFAVAALLPAALPFAVVAFGWSAPWRPAMMTALYAFLLVVIVVANVYERVGKKAEEDPRVEEFWKRLTRIVGVASLAYLPLYLVFDFLGPFFWSSLSELEFFPVFFVIWGVAVLVETVREAVRNATEMGRAMALVERSDEVESAGEQAPPSDVVPGDDLLDDSRMDSFGLSRREKETMRHLARGLTYKQIAGAMFVSEATIKTHVARAYLKTGTGTKIAAILALRRERPGD